MDPAQGAQREPTRFAASCVPVGTAPGPLPLPLARFVPAVHAQPHPQPQKQSGRGTRRAEARRPRISIEKISSSRAWVFRVKDVALA